MLSTVILLVATFLTAYADRQVKGQHPCNQKLQRVMDCAAAFATEVELFGKYSPIRAKPNCTLYSKLECCVSVELGISGCRDPKAIEKEIDNAIFEHSAYANCPRGLCDVSNIKTPLKILQKIDQNLQKEKQASNVREDHSNQKIHLRRLLAAHEGDVFVDSTETTSSKSMFILDKQKYHNSGNQEKDILDELIDEFGYKWDIKQKALRYNVHGSLKNDYSNKLHNQYQNKKALDENLQWPQQNSPYSNLSPVRRIQNKKKQGLPKKAEFYNPDKHSNLLSGNSQQINPHGADFVPSKNGKEKNRKSLDTLISELDSILDSDIEEPDTEPKNFKNQIDQQNAEFARQSGDEMNLDDKSLNPHGRVIYKDALIHRRFWIERQKDSSENSSTKEDLNITHSTDYKNADNQRKLNSTNKADKSSLENLETSKEDDVKSRIRKAIAARERHMKSASSNFLISDDHINQKLKKPMMMRSNRGSKPTSHDDEEDDGDDNNDDDDDEDPNSKLKNSKDTKNVSNSQNSSNSNPVAAKTPTKAGGFLRNDLSSDCVRDTLIAHTQYCKGLLTQHQPMIEEAKKTSSMKIVACYKLEAVKGCLGAGEYLSKCNGKEALEYTDLEHRITSDKSVLHCDGSLLQASLILLVASFCIDFVRRN